MKKIGLFLTFLIAIINNSYAQIELNPNSAHRLNVKAVGVNGDLWGVFGTTSTTSTNMVFRSGISNTNNWQNTGLITGVLGYSGEENMGIKLASYDRDLGLYGISRVRIGTNANFDRMVILNNGNVGINFPNPNAKLQIAGTGLNVNSWGTYTHSLKAGLMVDGTHSIINDEYDAIGIAGYGNNAKACEDIDCFGQNDNIGVLGTAGNTGFNNIGVYGHTEITDGRAYGMKAFAKSNNQSIGLLAEAFGNGDGLTFGGVDSYGVLAVAGGNNTIKKYGIYASATGSGVKYAGYFAGDVTNTGFTQLGANAPKIKVKKITGTTATIQGTWSAIPHGLTLAKILSVDVTVSPSSSEKYFKNWNAYSGFKFDYYVDATNVQIQNINNESGNILNKPLTIYITYEE